MKMAQTVVRVCDICETKEEVYFFCMNCEEVLCTRCKLVHVKTKKTKNDKVVLLSQNKKGFTLKSTSIICREHPGEEFSLYCQQCKQLICADCLDEQHKEHSLTSIKKITEMKLCELKTALTKLCSNKNVYESTLETEDKNHNKYTSCIDHIKKDILDHISTTIEKISEKLDNERDEHFSELEALQQREDDRHLNVCSSIQSKIKILTSAIESAENILDSDNIPTILQATHDATDTLLKQDDIEQTHLNFPRFLRDKTEWKEHFMKLGKLITDKNETTDSKEQHRFSDDDKQVPLKDQQMLLEMKSTQAETEAMEQTVTKSKHRVVGLNEAIQKTCDHEEQMKRKNEDSKVIQSLKTTLDNYEQALNAERDEHRNTKKQIADLLQTCDVLKTDYKNVWHEFETLRQERSVQGRENGEKEQLTEEINRLTALTISAEESINARDTKLKTLMKEREKLKEDVQTIPVFKAQVDIWEKKFDAERRARMVEKAENEKMKQEIKILRLQHRQIHQQQQAEENYQPVSCPKCNIVCPDVDTLQIHVLDCIE